MAAWCLQELFSAPGVFERVGPIGNVRNEAGCGD